MSDDIKIIRADARHLPLADQSVQCVITSPPYWALRQYHGEQQLIWYPPGLEIPNLCEHEWGYKVTYGGSNCCLCGAWRGAFGLEPGIDLYIQHTVLILREIRRVLRKDGVVFWNIGDSYGHGTSALRLKSKTGNVRAWQSENGAISRNGHREKDLVLMPQRVAIAAQSDGWYVRSDIIWEKPTAMPESCKDRPTQSYEHILMFTRSKRYFWNPSQFKAPCSAKSHGRGESVNPKARVCPPVAGHVTGTDVKHTAIAHNENRFRDKQNESFSRAVSGKLMTERNIRDVWRFPSDANRGIHRAAFPEELPRRCILAATKPGDLVLDPFAGSGTVGRVAIELQRRAVLVDLAYQEEAERRTHNVQLQLAEGHL